MQLLFCEINRRIFANISGILIAGFSQELEHIALVKFHAGLVKGVDPQHIGGNTAAQLQEVEHLAHLCIIKSAHVHGDDGNAAVYVGSQGAKVGVFIHKIQIFAG